MTAHRNGMLLLLTVGCAAWGSGDLLAQVPMSPPYNPAPIQPTLIDFITGMPISYKAQVAQTPPLLRPPFAAQPLDTPKGLASDIKANQLDAKKRCKAVKFLAKQDCQEFPTRAVLLKTVKTDPVEAVRYQAALAFQQQFKHGPQRRVLRTGSARFKDACIGCCDDPAIMNELAKRAYEKDEHGCFLEPSKRVRNALIVALSYCGDCQPGAVQAAAVAAPAVAAPVAVPEPLGPSPAESDVPQAPPSAEPGDNQGKVPQTAIPQARHESKSNVEKAQAQATNFGRTKLDPPRNVQPVAQAETKEAVVEVPAVEPTAPAAGESKWVASAAPSVSRSMSELLNSPASATEPPVGATVSRVIEGKGTVRIRVYKGELPKVGSKAQIFCETVEGTACLGDVEIIHSDAKVVLAKPVGGLALSEIQVGDEVILTTSAEENAK